MRRRKQNLLEKLTIDPDIRESKDSPLVTPMAKLAKETSTADLQSVTSSVIRFLFKHFIKKID